MSRSVIVATETGKPHGWSDIWKKAAESRGAGASNMISVKFNGDTLVVKIIILNTIDDYCEDGKRE